MGTVISFMSDDLPTDAWLAGDPTAEECQCSDVTVGGSHRDAGDAGGSERDAEDVLVDH